MKRLGCAALLLLSGCTREAVRRETSTAVPPLPVHVVIASNADWAGVYEATGTARARAVTAIASKLTGYVQQVNVREGDHVSAGQLLVMLETRDLDANYRRAEIGRAEVESAIPEADYAIGGAKASLELARLTFQRVSDLAAKKSVTTQEFDEASARVKSAQASFDMAQARRKQIDARLAQAEQEIRSASIVRDYARIVAPFAGVVTAKSVDPGTLATPGVTLLSIEQDGAYRLEASVDESRVPGIHVGQTAEVALEALDRRVNGRVSEILPSPDSTSHAYVVKIDLPAVPQLRSGMFGRACFPQAVRSALAIPIAAVLERGQLQSVFVEENGAARMRLVTLGQRGREAVEVLSGLTEGEKVIAPVPSQLQDGAAVEIRP